MKSYYFMLILRNPEGHLLAISQQVSSGQKVSLYMCTAHQVRRRRTCFPAMEYWEYICMDYAITEGQGSWG